MDSTSLSPNISMSDRMAGTSGTNSGCRKNESVLLTLLQYYTPTYIVHVHESCMIELWTLTHKLRSLATPWLQLLFEIFTCGKIRLLHVHWNVCKGGAFLLSNSFKPELSRHVMA